MKVLIAGGGTGGHVYPALTIAKAFQALHPGVEIHFVGTSMGIENKIIPKAGYTLHLIEVGRLSKNVDWSERFWTLVQLPFSLLRAAILVWRIKPDIVLGVGGYASGPALMMAALMGRFTAIWEPNAIPGLTNRLLSRFVSLGIVVFEGAKKHLKTKDLMQIPMPVREELEQTQVRVPKQAEFCVLVFGGSQGARAINEALLAAIKIDGDWLKQTRIVHQTGSHDFANIKKEYEKTSHAFGHVECLEYIDDMEKRYQWADLVICRAGTGTLSELAAQGKAAILIPLPSAADDHQTKNAEELANSSAAILLPQSKLSSVTLSERIQHFKNHPEELESMEKKIRLFHRPQSAQAIVQLLVKRQAQFATS